MPKQSKIRSPGTKSGTAATEKEIVGNFMCTRCARTFQYQRTNFPITHSPLFMKNNGYLTVCSYCVESMFARYHNMLGSESAAARRVCMKLDIYWNENLFDATKRGTKVETGASLIRTYISRANIARYTSKSFDDTLMEEAEALERERRLQKTSTEKSDTPLAEQREPSQEDIEFWGEGYTAREYELLNKKFEQWVGDQTDDDDEVAELPVGTSTLYRQICTLEMQISRNMAAGKPTESAINQLNNLIGSVNARPSQSKDDGAGGSFDTLPFGVGIRIFENNKPIPKPLPQLEDVDGIVRYISIWFLGHLCKMLHIKNAYCKMYEDEIERLRIENPELESEDDETVFNNIFGDDTQ